MIEDNGYGISVARKTCTAVEDNSVRAAGYGMPGVRVEGNDADLVHQPEEAIARARGGGGPTCSSFRQVGLKDISLVTKGYRPDGEVEELTAIDPITLYRDRLIEDGVAGSAG